VSAAQPADPRAEVQRLLVAGDVPGARAASMAWLEREPANAEAQVLHASVLMAGGNWRAAAELLAAPAAADQAPYAVAARYAICCAALGDPASAAPAFGKALAQRPGDFALRLAYAETLDALGDGDAAVRAYFRAICDAQNQGQWLSDASTSPGLRGRVKQAMQRVDEGRRASFMQALAPHIEAYGRDELKRVIEALDIHLGLRAAPGRDPRQQPKFFWMPSLPPTTLFDPKLFPWYETLEARTGAIRDEALARLREASGLEPFLGKLDKAVEAEFLSGDEHSRAWDAYFFFRHGTRFDEHHAACPRTSAALDDVPLTRIRAHAPEVLYSVLAPRSHITPHHGVTNTRVVTHLPLVVPEGDCALVVGGDAHRWRQGRCVTFDDSMLHEAWNRTGETRVVMILDTWNPHLEEPERIALRDLVERIGDFNAVASATS
jgi:aspartate beta-hydroxylase